MKSALRVVCIRYGLSSALRHARKFGFSPWHVRCLLDKEILRFATTYGM